MVGYLFVPSARFAVVAKRVNGYAAARGKDALDLDVFRLHQGNQVFHNDVDAIFVKRSVVAEAEQIKFEAFALNHFFAGKVADLYGGKIRLPRNGAKRCKFGAIEVHPVVVARVRVAEAL